MATIWLVRGVCIGLVVFSAPAMAWVEVCNKRSESATAAIAVGAMDPPGVSTGGHMGVTVEGWWNLAPGECARVSEVNSSQNWLYFHAHGKGGTLSGKARLCVRSKPFTSKQQFLMKDEVCTGSWKEAGFVRRESSAKNFRFSIT